MTSERKPTGQSSSSQPSGTSNPAQKRKDPPVPWYGRLLIAGVLIGATVEFFRLLLMAIALN